MRLSELNPTMENKGATLVFDCPKCKVHRIKIPLKGAQKWNSTGHSFNDLTVTPSILHDYHDYPNPSCKSHFFIVNGDIDLLKN